MTSKKMFQFSISTKPLHIYPHSAKKNIKISTELVELIGGKGSRENIAMK